MPVSLVTILCRFDSLDFCETASPHRLLRCELSAPCHGVQHGCSILERHNLDIPLPCARSCICSTYSFRVHFLSQVWDPGKWSPNNMQVLVAGTCVSLYGKIDFAGIIKLKIFRWGDYSGLSGWTLSTIT